MTEKQRANQKRYREKHKDKRRAYMAAYSQRPESKERAYERKRLKYGSDESYRAAMRARGKARYVRNRERILARESAKRKSDPMFYRRANLRKYGMTLEDLDRMFLDQENKCAICTRDLPPYGGPTGTHIDHCHSSGAVRQLLCPDCNQGLGAFRDESASLRRAADYIEKHRAK